MNTYFGFIPLSPVAKLEFYYVEFGLLKQSQNEKEARGYFKLNHRLPPPQTV